MAKSPIKSPVDAETAPAPPFDNKAELLAHLRRTSEAYYAVHAPTPERSLPRVEARIAAEKASAEDARHGIGGNGAPPSLATQIKDLGEAAYEGGWFGQTATDICADPRALRRWLDGVGSPNEHHVRLAKENLERRLARIQKALARHRSYTE